MRRSELGSVSVTGPGVTDHDLQDIRNFNGQPKSRMGPRPEKQKFYLL